MKRMIILWLLAACMVPMSLMANTFPEPTDVRIEGNQLLWSGVPDAGGYNIYFNFRYLTTVKNATAYSLQVDGIYQVVAFDQSSTLFSTQFLDSVRADYEAGVTQSESVSNSSGTIVTVLSLTCQNVGPGESCVASCGPSFGLVATGGACSTSDIVEADAVASEYSYSCTVPTFSGEVTAQIYCLDVFKVRD